MENEYVAWSRCGLPLETFEWLDFMQMEYVVSTICGGPGATLDAHYDTVQEPWEIFTYPQPIQASEKRQKSPDTSNSLCGRGFEAARSAERYRRSDDADHLPG